MMKIYLWKVYTTDFELPEFLVATSEFDVTEAAEVFKKSLPSIQEEKIKAGGDAKKYERIQKIEFFKIAYADKS